MNVAKHTPGPWKTGEKTVFADHGFKVYGYPISADGQAIARVHAGSVGKEAFSFGNQEANARLIALAPEMAEALRRLIAVTEEKDAYLSNFGEFEYARALLAKLDNQ